MDSLTHMVVGAALGDRLLNKKAGRWGALIGAFLNTFPDFDLLYSGIRDPRKYILYHRGHSHSLFYQLIYGLLIAALFWWIVKKYRDKKNRSINATNELLKHKRAMEGNTSLAFKESYSSISLGYWILFTMACILSHSLMDMCTNYGTRWLLPFSEKVISLNTISIADATLTIPIFLLVLIGVCCRNKSISRASFMNTAMIYTLVFFAFTFINKASVDKVFKTSLEKNKISYSSYMSNPTILNNSLWYALAQTDDSVYVTEYGTLWETKELEWTAYEHNQQLLNNWSDTADKEMMRWFSQGFFLAKKRSDTLDFYATKFGRASFHPVGTFEHDFQFKYWFYKHQDEWIMKTNDFENTEFDAGKMFRELIEKIRHK